MDGSAGMIDMAVMAMLRKLKGAHSVKRYMEHHALSDNARAFGSLLLGAPEESK